MGGYEVGGTAGGASDDAAFGTGSEGAKVDRADKGGGGTSRGAGNSGEC